MICNLCKQKEAVVHIAKVVNGKKEELYLCEDCAKKSGALNISLDLKPEFNLDDSFSFQSILSGIMDYINKGSSNSLEQPTEPFCKKCGTTLSEFKKNGLVGCDNCYANFGTTLNPIIRRVQGNEEHIGKIPKTSGKDIVKKKMVIDLKEKLQKAIALEEYEKAAEIRDKIREIDKNN